MAANSNIEWTEATWNPIAGCTPVSSGCLHCYAATMTHRLDKMGQSKYAGLTVLRNGVRTFNGKINLDESALSIPLTRKKPTMYFVNSMSDLFHEGVPFEFIDKVFAVMALCPQHTFQVLTKRPERMAEYLNGRTRAADIQNALDNLHPDGIHEFGEDESEPWIVDDFPFANVWLGTSVENQQAADERIPHLLKCPAAVRFLSCEPLLGPVDILTPSMNATIGQTGSHLAKLIQWVIVGGESGHRARACNIDWIRSIVRECKAAGVACFVKQLGAWVEGSHEFEGWKGAIDRWLLKHDDGTTSTCTRPILRAEYHPEFYDQRPLNAVAWALGDKKGGDIAEFPADLRVREFPKGATSAGG